MKYEKNELEGDALNIAVARAMGFELVDMGIGFTKSWIKTTNGAAMGFAPSSNWEHGGPIIEREKITVFHDAWWEAGMAAEVSCSYGSASLDMNFKARGDTALVAAMRCFVTSKMGAEVDL